MELVVVKINSVREFTLFNFPMDRFITNTSAYGESSTVPMSNHRTVGDDGDYVSRSQFGLNDGDSSTYTYDISGNLVGVQQNPGASTPGGTMKKPRYTSRPK